MIKYMIMNKDLNQMYAGTTVYDDDAYAYEQFNKLNCSNNWQIIQVIVNPGSASPGEIPYPERLCRNCHYRGRCPIESSTFSYSIKRPFGCNQFSPKF